MITKTLPSNIAKEGDTVIIYEDYKTSKIMKLVSNTHFDNRFGRFSHNDIIGKEFGSKINSKNGFIYFLKPNPTLITQSLPHRTQILYSVDISVIILKLDLKPGSIVVESGTGSGSLSSSLASVVGPKGFLYTFEFNQDRAEKAQKEFDQLGFKNIKVTWRDACKDGFQPTESDNYPLKQCDAVFLDLPKPWEAIGHSNKVLKRGGRICCFSPCIEQVQKTCLELKSQNFLEVRTFECIARNYERKNNPFKGLQQGQNNKKRRGQELEEVKSIAKKEKLETPLQNTAALDLLNESTENAQPQTVDEENKDKAAGAQETPQPQEIKPEDTIQQTKDQAASQGAATSQGAQAGDSSNQSNQPSSQPIKDFSKQRKEFYFTSGTQFTQGHTGYLTFAVKM